MTTESKTDVTGDPPVRSSELVGLRWLELKMAIEKNLYDCLKMKRDKDPAIAAMGSFGESMMREMQRFLPSDEAQHNDRISDPAHKTP